MGRNFCIIISLLVLTLSLKSQEAVISNYSGGNGSLRVVGDNPAGNPAGPTQYVVVKNIEYNNNHVTRNRIISREILFSQGDTIAVAEFMELATLSRQNLLNTSLFNFVEFVIDLDEKPYATIDVNFVERWYLWPFPILELGERNLNVWLDNPRLSGLNYGVNITRFNLRGRNETLGVLFRFGYQQNFSFTFQKPYFNPSQTLGFGFSSGINMRREMAYISSNNQQLFYRESSGDAYRQYYIESSLSYRPAIYNTHTLYLSFNYHQFADSLLILNPHFAPGNQSVVPYFAVSYQFKNDHRDIRAYPLSGHYFDIQLTRKGLGILNNEIMDMTSLHTSVRKFWTMAPRWYAAAGFNARVSEGSSMSYFNQQGLGFKGDVVRGFENYVVGGQHFFVMKSNLKYALVPQRSSNIAFIGNPRFSMVHYAVYLNVYADAGIVNDKLFAHASPLANRWLGGFGVGLDFVTYYDKVFRVEGSLNSLKEAGIFFHMLAPI